MQGSWVRALVRELDPTCVRVCVCVCVHARVHMLSLSVVSNFLQPHGL